MKYFTKQWYQDCQKASRIHIGRRGRRLAQKRQAGAQQVMDDYQKHYQQIKSNLPQCLKQLKLHDCIVTANGFTGPDFVLKLDFSVGLCTIDKLIFTNAKILLGDAGIDAALWLYDEIYLRPDGYEMHILFDTEQHELGEIAIQFDDVIAEEKTDEREADLPDQLMDTLNFCDEMLYFHYLALKTRFISFDKYENWLNRAFAADANERDILLDLVLCMRDREKTLEHLRIYFYDSVDSLDFGLVGKLLTNEIRQQLAEPSASLRGLTRSLYDIWCALPAKIAEQKPFMLFNYIDDFWSTGREEQIARELHTFFHYFDAK